MQSQQRSRSFLTRKTLFLTPMLLLCAVTTTACVSFGQPSVKDAPTAKPPRVEAAPSSRQSCKAYTLPNGRKLTQLDLEVGYATRGTQIVACDQARELALNALDIEHMKIDEWLAEQEKRRASWWEFWKKW